MHTRKHISIYFACAFLIGQVFFARAEGNHLTLEKYEAKVSLLAKESDVEKNINNVKVSHNPVGDQINVSFKLNNQSTVTIKLMDALGNEVLNLYNSTLESGTHALSFETEGKVTAGFYFVRVTSGIETVVKRVSIRSTLSDLH